MILAKVTRKNTNIEGIIPSCVTVKGMVKQPVPVTVFTIVTINSLFVIDESTTAGSSTGFFSTAGTTGMTPL